MEYAQITVHIDWRQQASLFILYFNNIVCVKMFDGHFKTITRPQQHTRYGLYLWYVGAMIFKKLATNVIEIGWHL